jgi:LSD1 subclass zinc finger protein
VVRKSFKLTKNKFRDRKTHRYFNCPTCHNTLRVPRGRGEIRVSCPVCKTITVTKS